MKIKEEVLRLIEEAEGEFVSGEDLAQKLSVSRNTIWRAIKALEGEGYEFRAVTNRGYALTKKTDTLNAASIKRFLPDFCKELKLQFFKTITSTNTVLKEMAEKDAPEGTVLIASEQTAGRGRLSRSFYSPAGTGVYMSLLMRPSFTPEKSLYITTAAAVAVSEAIEAVTKRAAKIKWVNDVYLNDKKACGILTEASFNMESKQLAYAVVGIGINLRKPENGFPENLAPIITSVFDENNYSTDARDRLIAMVISTFWHYYQNLSEKTFLKGYKDRSLLNGKEVYVLGGNSKKIATALDIDDEFRLHVRYKDGTDEYLQSGEVSVKPVC